MSVSSKAVWYIESHLDADLSLEAVAASVGVSPFHLCRAFALSTGLTLAGYVRARRLTMAVRALAQGAPDILAVALDAGYGSHEAFTRAFRNQFGLTPEQARAQAGTQPLNFQEPLHMDSSTITTIAPPRIAKGGELLVFGLSEHCESNAGMPNQWNRFAPYIGHIDHQVGHAAYGVLTKADDLGGCNYLCGVEVSSVPLEPAGFTAVRIPPQTYAVFRHDDHISTFSATWKAIWEHGLPSSGHKATEGPAFEKYGPEFDGRTGLGGLEVWIPVEA